MQMLLLFRQAMVTTATRAMRANIGYTHKSVSGSAALMCSCVVLWREQQTRRASRACGLRKPLLVATAGFVCLAVVAGRNLAGVSV